MWQDAVKLKLKVNTTFKQQQQAAPRLNLNEQRIFSCLFVLSGATTSASLHSTLALPRYPRLAFSLSLSPFISTLEMRPFCCCCHFLHFVLDINLIYSRISNQNKWKFILKIVFVFSISVGAARFIFTLRGQHRRSRGLHTPNYFLNNFPLLLQLSKKKEKRKVKFILSKIRILFLFVAGVVNKWKTRNGMEMETENGKMASKNVSRNFDSLFLWFALSVKWYASVCVCVYV